MGSKLYTNSGDPDQTVHFVAYSWVNTTSSVFSVCSKLATVHLQKHGKYNDLSSAMRK